MHGAAHRILVRPSFLCLSHAYFGEMIRRYLRLTLTRAFQSRLEGRYSERVLRSDCIGAEHNTSEIGRPISNYQPVVSL